MKCVSFWLFRFGSIEQVGSDRPRFFGHLKALALHKPILLISQSRMCSGSFQIRASGLPRHGFTDAWLTSGLADLPWSYARPEFSNMQPGSSFCPPKAIPGGRGGLRNVPPASLLKLAAGDVPAATFSRVAA